MTKGLNIVSRLTFENVPDGTLPTYIPDENQYSNYSYTKSGTVTVETIDDIKFIKLNSTTAKIYSPSIISDQSKKNFQAEFDVIFDTLKVDTNLVSIGVTTLANALRVVASNNPAQGLRLINGNNQISSYYRFENNKKYTICVGFKDNVISMYVDGTIIGYSYSEEFINSLNITTPSNIILGAPLNNTNDTNTTLYGKLGNINISSGLTVKHEESYTKYGTNLVSFLNFENLAGIGTYKTGLEVVYEGIEWRGVESAIYSNGYGNIKNISTDLTGDFTVKFSLKKFKVANANILKYGNYSVDYVAGFIPVPDPDVEVNEYTTSALNFENGIIDQIGTTVWNKEGTADVTSANKIFGKNSFETKSLGDSLYTNSNIITGGSTPFTIEFYLLLNSKSKDILYNIPIFSSTVDNASFSTLSRSLTTDRLFLGRQISGINQPSINSKTKINYNVINKITISYDSSATRIFINDKLEIIQGNDSNFFTKASTNPYYFLKEYNSYTRNAYGIIDNINIHDGIATKVRDPDPYEEFLVVDLAFDGENNSTKIVDNARLNERNEIKYNDNIVSLLHFEGIDDSNIIIDETGRIWNVLGSSKIKTDQKIIGSSSCYFNGNSSVSSSNSSDFAYGTNNFTWEFFTRLNVINENQYFIDHRQSNGNDGAVSYYRNTLRYYNPTIGTNSPLYNTNISLDINKWYHIAIVRNNNITSIYIDGIIRATGSDSHNFGNMECWLGAYSRGGNSLNGYIDEFRIIKGKAVYTENFTPPTEPFKYIPINKWTANGNAKLSTDQKFNGFSSLYIADSTSKISTTLNIDFSSDWTISFSYIANTTPDSGIDTPFFKDATNNFMFGVTNNGSSHKFLIDKGGIKYVFEYTNIWIASGTNIKIDLIKVGNIYRLYINNKMVKEHAFDIDHTFNNTVNLIIAANSVNGRNFSGYYKNFKIYKGVAVIPEDPTGKIQLDFDNNVIDKYGNSTWTNNGVTFDQVNSVKGHAAYFSGSYKFLQSNYTFDDNNISISFDMKRTSNVSDKILRSASGSYKLSVNDIGNISLTDKITTKVQILPNVYYKHQYIGKNNLTLYKINDVITSQSTNFIRQNWNSFLIGDPDSGMNGYIDNFKTIKDSREEIAIDHPAVHLPLETNAINTGFTPLTINSVGNPTYTTVDGKKCIKFEAGKYLTINSNNIFNLGTSSDFYIEFDFYPIQLGGRIRILSNNIGVIDTPRLGIASDNSIGHERCFYINDGIGDLYTSNKCILNIFNKIIIYRKSDNLYLVLNDTVTEYKNYNGNISFTSNVIISVNPTDASTTGFNGYMSNFKMFVGTHQPPESYNDKKVLDLDFKPTGKSYLFKDNNNKCVIHPVNITQRDYQDSQYCCTFNGTNQYLQLGKNDLLNFGNDDFVIEIKFKINVLGGWQMLICDNASTTNFIDIDADYKFLAIKLGGVRYDTPIDSIVIGDICNVIIQVISNVLTVKINNIQTTLNGEFARNVSNVNLNLNSNTYIGCYLGNSEYFNGTIYSIKVLRNTSDISLLEDENTDVIIGDTTLTLSNGTDSQEVIFDNKDQNDFRFIHSNDSTKLIVNEQILEVPNVENELNELSLFTDFSAEAKDIKTYNIAFEDEDTFSGNVPIHTQFGEIEDIDTVTDIFHVVDQGDFIVNGFFEGRPEDSRYQIRNRFDYIVMHSDSGPFNYNGINERYIDDYEIYLPDTNETMPIPTEPMIRGYITVSITPTECEDINFGVKVFRRSDNKLIGIYDFNNYICTIDNLDCNKRYDCIIFDQDVNLESRCLSNRTPIPY